MKQRISIVKNLCNGKPTIRGKRITVQTILELLSAGETKDEILLNYPSLVAEDIDACIKFASDLMAHNYSIEYIV